MVLYAIRLPLELTEAKRKYYLVCFRRRPSDRVAYFNKVLRLCNYGLFGSYSVHTMILCYMQGIKNLQTKQTRCTQLDPESTQVMHFSLGASL